MQNVFKSVFYLKIYQNNFDILILYIFKVKKKKINDYVSLILRQEDTNTRMFRLILHQSFL